jgi:hypothetical protein
MNLPPMNPQGAAPQPGGPQQAPAPQQGGPQQAPAPQQGGPQQAPAPQQFNQEQFNQAAQLASKILYDPKVYEGMIGMARKNPIPALANTAVMVLQRVDREIRGLSIDIMFSIGMTIIVDAADALQQSGVDVTEDHVSQALSDAITSFLQQNPKRFTPEEIQDGVKRLQEGIGDINDPGAVGQPDPGSPGILGTAPPESVKGKVKRGIQ